MQQQQQQQQQQKQKQNGNKEQQQQQPPPWRWCCSRPPMPTGRWLLRRPARTRSPMRQPALQAGGAARQQQKKQQYQKERRLTLPSLRRRACAHGWLGRQARTLRSSQTSFW